MTLKFEAKAIMSYNELNQLGIEHNNGYVKGWLVEDFIVGEIVEATDEYINFEYWVKVDTKTVRQVDMFGDDFK